MRIAIPPIQQFYIHSLRIMLSLSTHLNMSPSLYLIRQIFFIDIKIVIQKVSVEIWEEVAICKSQEAFSRRHKPCPTGSRGLTKPRLQF